MVKGNFLTEDSYLGDIKNPLTLNRYSYCIGNPLFYNDPSGHDIKSFAKRILFGNERVIEAKNRLIAKGDKWAKKITQEHLAKQNKFMDDVYDYYGKIPWMSNDTTYGQINNNFTAGVAGSAYATADKITSPEYLAASAYNVAAHPLQTLDGININGRDVLNGVMGIADKIKNKEYGALARGVGYAAGSAAQAYLLNKGIEKCGDWVDKRKTSSIKIKSKEYFAGDATFMDADDIFLKNIQKRRDVDPDGYYDIIAHGVSDKIQITHNGEHILVDHRTAGHLIQNLDGYNGQNIRLFSCNTGALDNGFAKNLANKLNVDVCAPTKYLWSTTDGDYFVAGMTELGLPDFNNLGEFEIFSPKR